MAKRLVCGVGINDADYAIAKSEMINGKRKEVWRCPFYTKWKNMITRCYSAKEHERRPTYIGCSVSDEWLTFSNFKEWMESKSWEGACLDKDFIVHGNKIYSSETCVFISNSLNLFTNKCDAARGEFPTGVYFNKRDDRLQAQCKNPITGKTENLGLYTCQHEAHEAWLKRKKEIGIELANMDENKHVKEYILAYVDRLV